MSFHCFYSWLLLKLFVFLHLSKNIPGLFFHRFHELSSQLSVTDNESCDCFNDHKWSVSLNYCKCIICWLFFNFLLLNIGFSKKKYEDEDLGPLNPGRCTNELFFNSAPFSKTLPSENIACHVFLKWYTRAIAESKRTVHRATGRGTCRNIWRREKLPACTQLINGTCMHINPECTYDHMRMNCAFLAYCFMCVAFAIQ